MVAVAVLAVAVVAVAVVAVAWDGIKVVGPEFSQQV